MYSVLNTLSSVLNTLSEYTYFNISNYSTSYTFLFVFKIVESLQCVLDMFWFLTKKLLFFSFLLVGRFVIFKLIFNDGSYKLHILVASKISMKKLRVMGMLLKKKMFLCCYSGEKYVVEYTLHCYIHFQTVVETGLLVLDFASLYNFVDNCETAVFCVLQVLSRAR